jgi:hypothetical protein
LAAQGIAAEIPQARRTAGLRNWSGKPGFRRSAPEMRPNLKKSAGTIISGYQTGFKFINSGVKFHVSGVILVGTFKGKRDI